MCLAIPGKVVKINGQEAIIKQGNHKHKVGFALIPNLKINDWVIINQNIAITKLTAEEAEEKIKVIKQLDIKTRR